MSLKATVPRIASAAVIVAGLATVCLIVWFSLDPNKYFYYRSQDRSQWTWPGAGVALTVITTMVEAIVAYVVVRPSAWRVWQRALLATPFAVPWTLWQSRFVVHMPGYYLLHLVWLWGLLFFLALAFAVSAVVSLVETVRVRALRNPV